MSLFEYSDYKDYVRDKIKQFPSKGRGQYAKLSRYLGIHTTLTSQIFNGERHLTPEQALSCSRFFGHSELETDMFCLLVDLARAGTHHLKSRLEQKAMLLREQSSDLKNRVPQDRKLTEEERAVFYSNWYYSAINLLTSIEGYQSVEAISSRLNLPREIVSTVLQFLVEHGICRETSDGYRMGPQQIHLGKESPLISRLHTNWRLKAVERSANISDEELMFTAPMSLSVQDAEKLKVKMLDLIDEIYSVVKDSPEEELMVFNMDFFRI